MPNVLFKADLVTGDTPTIELVTTPEGVLTAQLTVETQEKLAKDFTPITENQYGTHPALPTKADFLARVLTPSEPTVGPMGANEVLSLLNTPYNLRTSDAPAVQASKINQAIQDAIPGRKWVVFPVGTFLTDPITYDPRVSLKGQGPAATTLKANTAGVPLIAYTDNKLYNQCGTIDGFYLEGNNKATSCLKINLGCFANYQNINAGGYTEWAIDMAGTLLSRFHRILLGGPNGIRNVEFNGAQNVTPSGSVNQNLTTIQPNMVTMTDCGFYSVPGDSIFWDRGAKLLLDNCVWEGNGGGVRFMNGCPNSEGEGIFFKSCWWEINTGTCVSIGPSLGRAKHSLQDCMMQQYHVVSPCGVFLDAGDGFRQEVSVRDSTIIGHTADVMGRGTSARILEDFSRIDTHVESRGAQYGYVFNSFNTELGSRTEMGALASDTAYIQAVKSSRPYYFNTMSSVEALANPAVGDGALILSPSGASISTADTLFPGVATTAFAGGASFATLDLDLSSYSDFALEFLINFEPGVNKTLFAFGNYAQGGAMAMSHFVSYGSEDGLLYIGVSGTSGYDEKYYRVAVPFRCLCHVFVRMNVGGVLQFVLNGELAGASIHDDYEVAATTFQSEKLYLMGAPSDATKGQAGTMGYLAFYVGSNIPTLAEVQAHNAARQG